MKSLRVNRMTVVSRGSYFYRSGPFPEGKIWSGEVVVPLLRSLRHLRLSYTSLRRVTWMGRCIFLYREEWWRPECLTCRSNRPKVRIVLLWASWLKVRIILCHLKGIESRTYGRKQPRWVLVSSEKGLSVKLLDRAGWCEEDELLINTLGGMSSGKMLLKG